MYFLPLSEGTSHVNVKSNYILSIFVLKCNKFVIDESCDDV